MRMSELVSALGLWIFPVIGLVGFLIAFAIILLRVFRSRPSEMQSNARLPLEDGTLPLEVRR